MPTQTLVSIQQLFDGDVNASVPNIGYRAVQLFGLDKTHGNQTVAAAFRGSWQADQHSASTDTRIHTGFVCPPDRVINTDIYYRWHFSTNAATSGDVRLQLTINGADVGDAFTAGNSVVQDLLVDTQYEHYIATFGPFGSTLEIDGMHYLRFGRVGTAVEDTYPDPISTLALQAWYQTDRIAVPNYLPPYYS